MSIHTSSGIFPLVQIRNIWRMAKDILTCFTLDTSYFTCIIKKKTWGRGVCGKVGKTIIYWHFALVLLGELFTNCANSWWGEKINPMLLGTCNGHCSFVLLPHYRRYILKPKVIVSGRLQNQHVGLAWNLPACWPWPAMESEHKLRSSVTPAERPAIFIYLGVSCGKPKWVKYVYTNDSECAQPLGSQ